MAELYYKTYTTNIQQFMGDATLFYSHCGEDTQLDWVQPRVLFHSSIVMYMQGVKKQQFFFDFGPFWVFRTCSKVVQKGPKGTKLVSPKVFDHVGPFKAKKQF